MRDALSIISSATLLPPSAASPGQSASRRRHSSTTTKTPRKPNPNSKPQFATIPLISHSRSDNRQSLRYCTDLASNLAEDGRLEDFLMIAESVIASGVDPSEFSASLNSKNVSSGFARLLGEGKLDSVVKLLRGSRKLGIEPVHLLDAVAMESLRVELSRLLKYGHLEQLLSSLETLSGFRFPIKELVKPSDVINLCISKRDPTAAVRFVFTFKVTAASLRLSGTLQMRRYAQKFSHVEMLVCSIILEFGKKRDLASALTAFEESRKKLGSPNMHVYRTIIDMCGLCGDYLKSRTIFEELLAGNVTPNTYVLNSLMNVNAHDLDYTLGIYKKMEKLNVKADVASHNILLKSCCLASKVELAHGIYRMMRKLESEGVLKLDVFTYSSMIKVFADAKMWKLALEIKEDMVISGVTPNTIAWSSLISACANAGLVEKAFNLFNEMLESGGQPNSQCFNILLHACVEACQFDRAFRLFQCWKETGFQQIATDDSVNNSGEQWTVDQMRVSLREYSHLSAKIPFGPTTSTYNIMLKACGTNYYRAKALMDEMKTLGLSPNHISWSILIDICGGSGNVKEAVQILKTMREAGIQPDVIAYTTAIKICVEHKNPKLAYKLYAEMKRYRVTPNVVTYNTILRARSRYGSLQEVRQCLAVYQHMRKAGYKPNDYYLKQLIEEWCEGVIQNEQQHKGQLTSRTANLGPRSLLLEKVAVYLQDINNDSISIDLRGLSKLEARIMVLAVLRMIKEKYAAGNPIQEHVSVILGLQEQSPHIAKDESGVREAVIRLLGHDLGLKVLETSSSAKQALESSIRRPMVPQKLKVTRESLHQWLQRTGPMQTSN